MPPRDKPLVSGNFMFPLLITFQYSSGFSCRSALANFQTKKSNAKVFLDFSAFPQAKFNVRKLDAETFIFI